MHGTNSKYTAGKCRCALCTVAHTNYNKGFVKGAQNHYGALLAAFTVHAVPRVPRGYVVPAQLLYPLP
jgi:hypothetical protein